MSKLVRVEDIVKVVGMKNYIASLEMLETNLSYRGYQLNEKKEAVLEFLYSAKEKAIVHITIDKKGTSKRFNVIVNILIRMYIVRMSHLRLSICFQMKL